MPIDNPFLLHTFINLMSDIAIKFENVSKLYELGTVGTGTLSHDLKRWWITSVLHKDDPYLKIGETNDRSTKGDSKFVYALKDIDFEVKQGDVLGIIGKNGAGKSTLLKLLSRVTAPTTGKIYTKGRIASLLEVGTGFHPELTGRENIYMNGTIMGMKKWEIDKKLDEIVDFSGCERYLDTPVKRYSSGMMVRLGFAVAAHLEPEILVVDEVLAVGDAEFQKKAIGKMQDVSKGEGRTVLFVSHNMAAVRNLCMRGIVLETGNVVFDGNVTSAVSQYLSNTDFSLISESIIGRQHRPWIDIQMSELEIVFAKLLNDRVNIATDEPLSIELHIKKNSNRYQSCQYSISFEDEEGMVVSTYVTKDLSIPRDKDCFVALINIPNHGLTKRKYWINATIGTKDFSTNPQNYDSVWHILSFEVVYFSQVGLKEYMTWSKHWGPIMHINDGIEGCIK